MTAVQVEQDIRARMPAFEDHAFELTTDGSGADGSLIGIAGSWVLRPVALTSDQWRPQYRGAIGLTVGSVQRAEMLGLLEGLRCATVLLGVGTLDGMSTMVGTKIRDVSLYPKHKKFRILWRGDRQNLVYQVARDRDNVPYFTRRTELDLWPQLGWFEHLFDITCIHHARNTTPDARLVDEISGKIRSFMVTIFKQLNPNNT